MPHQFGLAGYAQSPPSPPSQHGALIPRLGGGAVVPSSVAGSAHAPTSGGVTMFRQIEDKRLTREAMERYLRDRNDMIIYILHAKVRYTANHSLQIEFIK